jgi:ribose-phosphate pyrophosphokinase
MNGAATPLTILSGSANRPLAEAAARHLATPLGWCAMHRFPDGEIQVEARESLRAHDVYLIQPTGPPVAENLLELLFLADACRRAGAARLTAVIPYFGYARQDRRAAGREAVGARVVADLIGACHLDRVVTVDLHTAALEGFFSVPLEHLTAVPLLAEAVRARLPENAVVVAPDLGAAKLAGRYARILRLPVAIVHKARLGGETVEARGISGEVRGLSPLLVDDMISTGGTIEAAARALLEAGCAPEIAVVATHGLLVGPARARLDALPIRRLVVTDSVAPPEAPPRSLEVVSLAPILAQTIKRLHAGESLRDLIHHE